MGGIDKAALLEALGHEEAAKVLRALEDGTEAPVEEAAEPPARQPSGLTLVDPQRFAEQDQAVASGRAMLEQMRRQGIIGDAA